MLRPAFWLRAAWLLAWVAWSPAAVAQADSAPLPPVEPMPAAPVNPTPMAPVEPPAGVEPAPAPLPAAPPTTAPPSGAFPLPPEPSTPATRPAPAPLPPPPSPVIAEPAPAPYVPPRRPTEGLFEERPGAEVRHYQDGPKADDDTDHFKIGPVVGAGVPSLLSVGGTLKVTRFLGAGVNFGLIPQVQLSYYGDATLSYKHLDFYGRVYPFGGGLFLGAGAGYATVQGTLKKAFPLTSVGLPGSVSYESRGSVRTLMLTAVLGYFHTFDIGLSLGVDAGAQIPIAPSKIELASDVTGDLPAAIRDQVKRAYLDPNDEEVRDTLERIGRSTIPTLNFRIGWIL